MTEESKIEIDDIHIKSINTKQNLASHAASEYETDQDGMNAKGMEADEPKYQKQIQRSD